MPFFASWSALCAVARAALMVAWRSSRVRRRLDSCSAKISRAGLLHGFAIGAQFFLHGHAAGFRLDPRAFGALVALGEHAFHGLEETPAHEQIEKKNDNDRGNSRQEQFTELVKDLH